MFFKLIKAIAAGTAGKLGSKAMDLIALVLFLVLLFFMAKALVFKAMHWGEKEQLKAQVRNKDVVIETLKTVSQSTEKAVEEFSQGGEIKQQKAVETIERLDAVTARQVLRQVDLATNYGKAQAVADLHTVPHVTSPHESPGEHEADTPENTASEPALSKEDLEFIRASNRTVQAAYEDAVQMSKY